MEQGFLNAYIVDLKYVRDLAKVDDNVMSISPQIGKEVRPFIGIVIVANDKKYCIPLSCTVLGQVKLPRLLDVRQDIEPEPGR